MMRLLLVIAIFLAACGAPRVEQRALPEPNPTSYDFAAPIEAVHGAVDALYQRQFSERPLNTFSVIKSSDELLSDEQRRRFAAPGGADDRYLWFMHDPMSLSQVYLVGGAPAPYIADFYLTIEALDGRATRVAVEALGAQVLAGKTLLPRHELSRANIYVPVSPTTVEEYRFLLRIGEMLGQPGMPSLQLPIAPGED